MGTHAAWPSTKVRRAGGGVGGVGAGDGRGRRRDPRGRRALGAPRAAPSRDLLGLARPSPTPPEGRGRRRGCPRYPVLKDPVRALFSRLLFRASRPPRAPPQPQVEGVWGESGERLRELPAPHTAPVGGRPGLCLPARCPLPPGYFGPGSRRKRSRGVISPPSLPDAGRSGVGKGRRRVPGERGLGAAPGEGEVVQGGREAGSSPLRECREYEVQEFPPAARSTWPRS